MRNRGRPGECAALSRGSDATLRQERLRMHRETYRRQRLGSISGSAQMLSPQSNSVAANAGASKKQIDEK